MRRILAPLRTTWAFLLRDARATLHDLRRAWAVIFPMLSALWRFLTSRALWIVAIVGILGIWLLWPRLYDYLNPQTFDNRKDVVVGIGQGLGAIILAAGVFFTFKNWQTSREGQITERFTRAIQQLGDPKLEVRLGGIYALERIARDSPRDHWTIMEVLTAFVRENAPWKDDARPATAAALPAPAANAASAPPATTIKPRTDIQAILTVIGRRPEKARKEERKNDHRLDMSGTNLRGADLRDAHMEGANLRDAHLEGANLRGVHLERAFLWDAHLERADLRDADLEEATLRGAHLEGADLTDAIGLTHQQLASAITDEHTILPDYLKEQVAAPPSSP